MPATRKAMKRRRLAATRKKPPCHQCRRYSEQLLALACENEKLEAGMEQESARLEAMARNYELANIDIQRKASILKIYEMAWLKGREEPYTNGRCAK